MPIDSTDIIFRGSVTTSPDGDSTANTDVNTWLGKHVSTTPVDLVVSLNNLFDDVTGDESSAGSVEYRCIFVLNNHGTLSLTNTKVWLSSEVASGATVAIGLDPVGAIAKGSVLAQATDVASETDAPAGVTFSSPTTKLAGLSIGTLAPGEVQAIWVRRTVPAGTSAMSNDGATIRVEGDTEA